MVVIEHYPEVVCIGSNADAGGRQINKMLEDSDLLVRASLIRPVYLSLLEKADFIIGNSSSGLIEAPMVKTPAINIGSRQLGRKRGPSVIDCEGTPEAIRSAISFVKAKKWTDEDFVNPYYRPDTLEKMTNRIKEIVYSQFYWGVKWQRFNILSGICITMSVSS